jgi:hypothetical protein
MQQSVGRGLFGSSSSGALQRGLIGDYARGVGQLGAQIGGVRAQIEQGFAGQTAAGLGNLANLTSGMAQSRAGIQGGIQFQGPQGLAESYGTLGTALGGAFDNGLGSAIGGAFSGLFGAAGDAWEQWAKRRSSAKPSIANKTQKTAAKKIATKAAKKAAKNNAAQG